MAPLPDAKHLLELLQRAAEELKNAQKETLAGRAELKALHEKLALSEAALLDERRQKDRLQHQLQDVGNVTMPPGLLKPLAVKTQPFASSPLGGPERPRDEKTSVGGDEPNLLGERVKGLQDELTVLERERRELRERIKSLEAELATPTESPESVQRQAELEDRLRDLEAELATPRESAESVRRQGELEHELSNTRQQLIVEQARGADLLTRLQAWEARSQDLEQALSTSRVAGDEEHAQVEVMAGQLSQVETELTTERARTQAMEEQLRSLEQGSSDEQKRLFDATSRVAQLEVEIAGLKGRRDELNVEIGKVENERNAARARAAELEHAAQAVQERLTAEHKKALELEHQKRSELEQQLSREKDKHQITAQKLLEARGRQRESEEQLHLGAAATAELRATLEAQTSAHQLAVNEAQRANEDALRGLHAQVAQLTAALENANTEWRHVDRQYEQLHREMLVILDQRDEARRELEALGR